jgi:hypothetical protein
MEDVELLGRTLDTLLGRKLDEGRTEEAELRTLLLARVELLGRTLDETELRTLLLARMELLGRTLDALLEGRTEETELRTLLLVGCTLEETWEVAELLGRTLEDTRTDEETRDETKKTDKVTGLKLLEI